MSKEDRDFLVNTLWSDRKRWIFFGLPFSFTKYTLLEDKLVINTGVLALTENEVRLYRILDIKLTRSFGERIFGLGTIEVVSSDKSLGAFEIKHVKNARRVKELLSKQVEDQRDKKRVYSREVMSEHDYDHDGMDDHFEQDDDNN